MSARLDLAALLTPVLPSTWSLDPYPRSVDNLDTGKVAVIFEAWKIRPHPIPSRQVTEFTVALLEPTTGETADDHLDVSLSTFLSVLDTLAGRNLIRWEDATRGTYRDQYPAYLVTVTIDTETD